MKEVENKHHEVPNKLSKLHNFTAGPLLSAEDFGRMKTMSSVSITIPEREVKIEHDAKAATGVQGTVLFH